MSTRCHLLLLIATICMQYSFLYAFTHSVARSRATTTTLNALINDDVNCAVTATDSRRSFISQSIFTATTTMGAALVKPSLAEAISSSSSQEAEITSKIFITLKGLPALPDDGSGAAAPIQEDTITIGLFGKDAPQATSILEQLVSDTGYFTKCKPKETRTLQREQLEANKVYNACMETQDTKGVNYDLSTVWRIVQNERIDLGAVSGKFVSRESPLFSDVNSLRHDAEGVVSVRRGNDGAFGFTIYPGVSSTGRANNELDETNIVVGRVIGGMDVLRRLNNDIPVVQSSAVNYKAFSGGDSSSKRSAPSRACRYGSSELYCNEFKPLKKISIFRTGLVV